MTVGIVAAVALLAFALRSWVPAAVSGVGMMVLAVCGYAFMDRHEPMAVAGIVCRIRLARCWFCRCRVPATSLARRGRYREFFRFVAMGHSTVVLGGMLRYWTDLDSGEMATMLFTQAGWALIAAAILGWHARSGAEGQVDGGWRWVISLALGLILSIPAMRFIDVAAVDLAFVVAAAVVLLACFWTRDEVPVGASTLLALVYATRVLLAGPDAIAPNWHFAVFIPVLLIFTVIWRVAAIRPAIWAGVMVAIIGMANQFHLRFGSEQAPGATDLIYLIAFGLAVLVSGQVVASAPGDRFLNSTTRTLALWAFPVGAVLMLFPTFTWPGTPLYPIATALWGVTGIVIFAGGLILRRRAHRIVGLLGLLLCVIRVFVVDLEDTFYRIIAFGAVAVVLLVIGYLYTRFREFIERDE